MRYRTKYTTNYLWDSTSQFKKGGSAYIAPHCNPGLTACACCTWLGCNDRPCLWDWFFFLAANQNCNTEKLKYSKKKNHTRKSLQFEREKVSLWKTRALALLFAVNRHIHTHTDRLYCPTNPHTHTHTSSHTLSLNLRGAACVLYIYYPGWHCW